MSSVTDSFQRAKVAPGNGTTPPAAKAPTTPVVPAARDAQNTSLPAQALAQLAAAGAVSKLGHEAWAALGKHLSEVDDKAFIQASQSLSPKGMLLVRPRPGLVFALDNTGATALVEPSSQRVRLTEPTGNAKLFTAGKLSESITMQGDWAQVKIGTREERWNLMTGEGETKGKPIVIPQAGVPASEGARKAWAKTPPNRLVEPVFSAYGSAKAYAKAYDEAVVKSGGQVLEALDPPMTEASMAPRYNCHSFATTGGQGDLADPFLGVGQARWLEFPFFQLREQGFAEVPAKAKVRPGDVVLYRKDGEATHTGVVRAVDADGNPSQIESKWGAFGRYLHGPLDVPGIYGEPTAYYRKP